MIGKTLAFAAALFGGSVLATSGAMAQQMSPAASSPAQVAAPGPAGDAVTAPMVTEAALQAPAASPFGQVSAVSTQQLGAITGQGDLAQVVNAKNTSNVSNNSVSGNSVTGTIDFRDQSFQGMNGLSVLSANTGNNVAINASLNVNISIQP